MRSRASEDKCSSFNILKDDVRAQQSDLYTLERAGLVTSSSGLCKVKISELSINKQTGVPLSLYLHAI